MRGERGEIELGLGVVTTTVAAALVGFGSYQTWRGVQVRRYCEQPATFEDPNYEVYCSTPFGGDSFVSSIVSSSLSFAFAVPIAVAGGTLLRRGLTLRRAWRRSQGPGKVALQPWSAGPHSAGFSLRLAF